MASFGSSRSAPDSGDRRAATHPTQERLSVADQRLWLDYATVILNARGPLVSPLYSLRDAPLLMIPIFAWLGRGRHDRPRGI